MGSPVGVPIIRVVVFRGPCCGPPTYAIYHMLRNTSVLCCAIARNWGVAWLRGEYRVLSTKGFGFRV